MASSSSRLSSVVVITCAGGMGLTIARRLLSGRLVLLAQATLNKAHIVDISDPTSGSAFADAAANAGRVAVLVHTAGISPATTQFKRVLEVDLLDTALVIDAPYPILAPGGSIVCIASMTVHMLSPPLTAEAESRFATTPTSDLLSHPSGQEGESDQRGLAYYSLATRANQLCVHGVAHTFGQRGCRIDGVSPGVFYTAMVEQAPVSADGAIIRRLASSSAIGVAARGQMR